MKLSIVILEIVIYMASIRNLYIHRCNIEYILQNYTEIEEKQ